MRRLFAFLAVVALLMGSVTAAAAQSLCSHDGLMASQRMDMSTMPGGVAHVAGSATRSDPCCDPGGKSHETSEKSCMQACAAACAVAVALPASSPIGAPIYARASIDLSVMVLAHGLQPARLERPPKSIA
jgi:hypothetical protein